jgi:tetratricopeptide (TPR) repeat protein
MLYAYELDLLNEADECDLEAHLLECSSCFNRALAFEKAAHLIGHDPGVRESVEQTVGEQSRARRAESRRWKLLLAPGRPFIPVSLVALVILVALVLKPWRLEISPDQEALAMQDRLTVMYFDNLTDPRDSLKLGQIATSLLVTNLSESQYFDVISSQRLYDILKLLNMEGIKQIDRGVASQVAEKARARWMLTGSILQMEPQLVVASEIVEVATGNAIAAQRATAVAGESIFSVVDSLTMAVRSDLPLPIADQQESDRLLAGVTSRSAEAYRYYLEGVDYFYKLYFSEAAGSFERAIEYDSTFAMAYYYLARTRDPDYITGAVEHADKASETQRHYIYSLKASISGDVSGAVAELEMVIKRHPEDKEALQSLGQFMYDQQRYDDAVSYFARVIEIDPVYKPAYNMLSYAYDRVGNVDKSIWAIEQYIALAPGEANPYDTRGEILAGNGRIEEAIESYRTALRIKPDFYSARMNLGLLLVLVKDYTAAQACFEALAAGDDAKARSLGRLYLAYVPVYQGKFRQALRVLGESIAAEETEQDGRAHPSKHGLMAVIHLETGDPRQALSELDRAIDLSHDNWPDFEFLARRLRVQILAEGGDVDKARQEAEGLRRDLTEADYGLSAYWYAIGAIQLAEGDPSEAVTGLEKAAEDTTHFPFPSRYMLARTYLELERLGKAVAEFEKLRDDHADPLLYFGSWTVKSYYYLGVAYERSGWNEEAASKYAEFLDIWKEADPGIPEVDSARERLRKLEHRP